MTETIAGYLTGMLTCHEETTDDDGMLAPCDQHAVGRRFDPEFLDRAPYPVCVEHVRAPITALANAYAPEENR